MIPIIPTPLHKRREKSFPQPILLIRDPDSQYLMLVRSERCHRLLHFRLPRLCVRHQESVQTDRPRNTIVAQRVNDDQGIRLFLLDVVQDKASEEKLTVRISADEAHEHAVECFQDEGNAFDGLLLPFTLVGKPLSSIQ